jgi:hypothetical protein
MTLREDQHDYFATWNFIFARRAGRLGERAAVVQRKVYMTSRRAGFEACSNESANCA